VQPNICETTPGHTLLAATSLLLLHLHQRVFDDGQDECRRALEATLLVVLGLPALLSKAVDGLQQVWEAVRWH
jgi:hypothetical protein